MATTSPPTVSPSAGSPAGSTAILEARNLTKRYTATVLAVDGLDLTVGSPGTVHGFLGPNGSGKTTTIRCLLGLVRPTSGVAQVFGVDSATGLHNVIHRVGAIVEYPKLFPHFTGRKNLDLLAKAGGIDRSRVATVLGTVGLADRGDDTFDSYSLGMKQRLAIAAALLKDPDLLILDEPANGLDPAGIAEMRTLIRSIADEGKAVLVSSHQLAEIELVCDEVTIIANGRVIRSDTIDNVRNSVGAETVVVTIAERDQALHLLRDAGIDAQPSVASDEIRIALANGDTLDTSTISQLLGSSGLWVSGLRVDRTSLESAFLALTGGQEAPPPPGAAPAAAPPPPPTFGTGA